MSLVGKAEIILSIQAFKNINLYNRGFYYMEIRLFTETEKNRYFAQAKNVIFNYVKNNQTKEFNFEENKHIWAKSSGAIAGEIYRTKAIPIIYIDEKKDILETILYDHNFDFPMFYEETGDENCSNIHKLEEFRIPLLMEVSLFYCAGNPKDKIPKTEEYSRVNSKLYRLGNIMEGIFKYVPVQFINEYSSILEITVHSVLLDIDIRSQTVYEQLILNHNKNELERKEAAEQSKHDPWMLMSITEHKK